MKTITLTNSFHHTSVNVRVPDSVAEDGQQAAWFWIQTPMFSGPRDDAGIRRYRRVARTLCGCGDCRCGVVR